MSRVVTGCILQDEACVAAFSVFWTMGEVPRHGAEFYLILGEWGDEAAVKDRFAVATHFFAAGAESGFAVVDAAETPMADHPLVGRTLAREEVVGTPLAPKVFELIDFLCLADIRLAEIVREWTRSAPDAAEFRKETPGHEQETEPSPNSTGAGNIMAWVVAAAVILIGGFKLLDLLQDRVEERAFQMIILTIVVLFVWYFMHRYVARRRAGRSASGSVEEEK